jgi:hypothetical protein
MREEEEEERSGHARKQDKRWTNLIISNGYFFLL